MSRDEKTEVFKLNQHARSAAGALVNNLPDLIALQKQVQNSNGSGLFSQTVGLPDSDATISTIHKSETLEQKSNSILRVSATNSKILENAYQAKTNYDRQRSTDAISSISYELDIAQDKLITWTTNWLAPEQMKKAAIRAALHRPGIPIQD
jgi:hypothetical protein